MSLPHNRLLDLGWTTQFAHAFAPYAQAHYPARVCRIHEGGADLAGASGAVRASFGGDLLRRAAGDRSALPAVGDWAAVRDWPDERITLEAVLPRRTMIAPDSADPASPVAAANVDLVVIVERLDPEPDVGRIERLLALARGSGATPVVVLTRADLVPDPDGMRACVAATAPGVDVVAMSTTKGEGLDALRSHLAPGRTVALLGPSGAATSTLTNALAGAAVVPTGTAVVLPGLGVLLALPGPVARPVRE